MIHSFKKNGHSFTLVQESGPLAIYRGVKGKHDTWEVHLTRPASRHPRSKPGSIAHELHPSTREWGRYGWTFQSLARAVRKMEALHARIARKHTLSAIEATPELQEPSGT